MSFIGRVHGIDAFEYQQGRVGNAVLVSAGTGLMLSLMDQCPRLRWCLDVDCLSSAERARFPGWLACMQNVTDFVAVTGWYCATDPTPLANAVRRVRRNRIAGCYVVCHGRGKGAFDQLRTADTLAQLIEQVNAWVRAPGDAGASAVAPLAYEHCPASP